MSPSDDAPHCISRIAEAIARYEMSIEILIRHNLIRAVYIV